MQQDPLAGPSALRDIIRPQFHQINLVAEQFIKGELGIKLNKGTIRSPHSAHFAHVLAQMIKYVA